MLKNNPTSISLFYRTMRGCEISRSFDDIEGIISLRNDGGRTMGVNSISIHHSKVLHLDAPPLFRAENNGRRKRCTREIRGGRSENRESRAAARDSPPLIWSPWFRPRREGGRRRRKLELRLSSTGLLARVQTSEWRIGQASRRKAVRDG